MRWGSTWRYTVYEHRVCAYNILSIYISPCLQKEMCGGSLTIICSPVQRSPIALYIIEMLDEMRIEKALYSIYATGNNRLKTTHSIPCMNNSSIDCDPSSYAYLVAFTTEGKYIGHLPNIIKIKIMSKINLRYFRAYLCIKMITQIRHNLFLIHSDR